MSPREDLSESGFPGWCKREFDALTDAPLRMGPTPASDPELARILRGMLGLPEPQAEVSEAWARSLLVQTEKHLKGQP